MVRTASVRSPHCIERITEVVADQEGVDPIELPPMYEAVDTAALSAILDREGDDVTVEFTYCGYRIVATDRDVTVDADT